MRASGRKGPGSTSCASGAKQMLIQSKASMSALTPVHLQALSLGLVARWSAFTGSGRSTVVGKRASHRKRASLLREVRANAAALRRTVRSRRSGFVGISETY